MRQPLSSLVYAPCEKAFPKEFLHGRGVELAKTTGAGLHRGGTSKEANRLRNEAV